MTNRNSRKDGGVPRPKKSGSVPSGVPSRKNATASRPTGTSRKEKARAERHALYKRMLKFLTPRAKEQNSGFCAVLYSMCVTVDVFSLTELHALRPDARIGFSWWWKPWEWRYRIKALKAAIKATEPALGMRKARSGSSAKQKAGAKRSLKQPGREAATPRKK